MADRSDDRRYRTHEGRGSHHHETARNDDPDRDWRIGGHDSDRRAWDPGNYGALDDERGPRQQDQARGYYASRGDAAPWSGEDRYSAATERSVASKPGPHRGKGPKGYIRSDDRIREEVSERLSEDDMLDASGISVTVTGGEVTLDGSVTSRVARRAAEDLAEGCSGVTHVQNNLRVHAVPLATQRP